MVPSLQYVRSFLHEYGVYAPGRCLVLQKEAESLSEQSLAKLGFVVRQIEQTQRNTRMLHSIYSGLLCEYRGKSRVIPFLTDIYTLEADLARFIVEMDQDAHNRSDSRLLYVAMPPAGSGENGHTEEDPYRYVMPWIEYAGFIPIVLPPSFTELKPEIPLLVIGSDYFDEPMLTALDVFLQKNGSAAFFVSANTVNVRGNWAAQPKQTNGVADILYRFGFNLHHNLLMDSVNFRLTLPASDNSRYTHINYPFWVQVVSEPISKTQTAAAGVSDAVPLPEKLPAFIPFGKTIQLFWPSSLTLSAEQGRIVFPVLVSSPKTAVQHPPYHTDPYEKHGGSTPAAAQTAYCIAGASTGTGKGRIFTAADEYCLSTAIEYTNSDANLDFMVNVLHWIAGQDALLQVKQKQPGIAPFRSFENEAVFSHLVLLARIITLAVIPIFAIASGIAAYLYKRKREME